MVVTEALLTELEQTVDLCAWVQGNGVTLETLDAWMAQSRPLYATQVMFAVRIAKVTMQIARCLPPSAEALANWMLGNALVLSDDLVGGAGALAAARQQYLAIDQPVKAAQASIGLFGALTYTGELNQAIKIGHEAERTLLTATDHPLQEVLLGKIYNNLGLVYEQLQRFEEAISAFDRKLAMLPRGHEWARTRLNRACVLAKLNLFDEANADFGQVEQEFMQADARPDLVRLYLNWGLLDADWKRHQSAETRFEHATRYLAELNDSLQLSGYAHHYRALNWLVAGETHPQLAHELNRARIAFDAYGLVIERGLCWVTIGRYYTQQAQWETAHAALAKALTIADQNANTHIRWQTYFAYSQLFAAQEQFAEAIEQARLSIAEIESLRTTLNTGTFRATFLTDKLAVYTLLTALHLQQRQTDEALQTAEQSRARLLAERLEGRIKQAITPLTTTDDPQIRLLAKQLQAKLTTIDQLQKPLRGQENEFGIVDNEATRTIAKLEQEAVTLMRAIQRQRPDFEPLPTGQVRALPELLRDLPPSSCVVYLMMIGGDIHCLLIGREGVLHQQKVAQFAALQVVQERLTRNIEWTLSAATRKGKQLLRQMMPHFLPEAQMCLAQLGDMLIAPLLPVLSRYTHWIIAPERELYYIPFHALRVQDRYLIEQVAISYTPSLNVLHLSQQPTRNRGNQMALLGYSGEALHSVAEEIQLLSDRFPTAEVQLPATTDFFLQEAQRFRVIHLAAHADFHKRNPMLSAFALADRSLTLAEMAQLHLRAEMVTLSACETGFGRKQGSEFISLASGLMAAGARSLVVSQWRVDDAATLLLMDAFYHALQQGQSRVGALQQAQIALLELATEPEYAIYAHPAYWSPFVLLGNWRPLFQSTN